MDIDTARWILEFLIRQPIEDRVINSLLCVLPLSNDDLRLKKTILLRRIQKEISNGLVSEKILEFLEMIEEIDYQEGTAALESMKAAYCAVAVDCTVKFLRENPDDKGMYYDAVKRIWRGRVLEVERTEIASLVSEQLKDWRERIETALWDPSVCENVLKRDTSNEALSLVRVCIAKMWENMGPSFLELAARTMNENASKLMDSENILRGNDGREGETGAPDTSQDLVVNNRVAPGEGEAGAPDASQDLVVNNRVASGENVCNMDIDSSARNIEEQMLHSSAIGPEGETRAPDASQDLVVNNRVVSGDNVSNKGVDSCVGNIEEQMLHSSAIGREEEAGAPDASQDLVVNNRVVSGENVSNMDVDLSAGNIDEHMLHSSAIDMHKGSMLLGDKHAVPQERCSTDGEMTGTSGELVSPHASRMATRASSKKYDCVPTPEVERVQEALKLSSLELHAVVKDPLPDALRMAETVLSDIARERPNHELLEGNQNRVDVDASASVDEGVEAIQANENSSGNNFFRNQNNMCRPSLMARNSTARTFEWDGDSIESSSEGSPNRSKKTHLPSPKKRVVSPLKKYEFAKLVRRRKMKRWSTLEEETLRTAVKKFGKGNWKLMLNCYREVFEERTEVDLKDKWRNMLRG